MPVHLRDLRESNAFLNLLLEQMPAVVLLTDADLHILELNDAYTALFGQSRQQAIGQRCGNALGCAFAVSEEALCGETSQCHRCQLRQAAQTALQHGVPADRIPLSHTFWVHGQPQKRHLEFSTRLISFEGRSLVALILYDVTELTCANRELQRQQAEITASLRAAGAIQQALLPKTIPHSHHLAVAWHCQPCQGLGGDLLNVMALGDDHLGFYLLDVAGHGPASAMISLLAHQTLHPHTGILVDHSSQSPRIRPPEEVLQLLNREFPFERFERHLTIVYGVVDRAAGTLTLSNAGHCRPVIFLQGNILEIETCGTIIGLEGVPFGQETFSFLPGDRLLLVSDGLLEAMDPQRRMFGDLRWPELLPALAQASAQEMVQTLLQELGTFTAHAPLADDVSLLALERLAH